MKKWSLRHIDNEYVIHNVEGVDLNYNPSDGIQILEDDGFAFLDLNGNGRIDSFEDWRIDELERYRQLCLNLI